MKTRYTFCRICLGRCGLVVDIDEETDRIVKIRGGGSGTVCRSLDRDPNEGANIPSYVVRHCARLLPGARA